MKAEIASVNKNKTKGVKLYKDMVHLETQFVETVEEEVLAMDYDKRLYL